MKILHSETLVSKIEQEIKFALHFQNRCSDLHLVDISCVNRAEISSYIKAKKRVADRLGIRFTHLDLSNCEYESDALQNICNVAAQNDVHGVLIEFPIKDDWSAGRLLDAVPAEKDVDALGSVRRGQLLNPFSKSIIIMPATVAACLTQIEAVIPLLGTTVAVVGQGRAVGLPLAAALARMGATVLACNEKTQGLPVLTQLADVVVLATGQAQAFDESFFRNGQILIDVGTSLLDDRLVGDLALDRLITLDLRVTPVPGGIGPLTTFMLFKNLVTLSNKIHE